MTTLYDEMRSALGGLIALVTGNRQAPSYFDFSQRGLIGSFIALLIMTMASLLLQVALGIPPMTGSIFGELVINVGFTAALVGASFLVLRQFGRPDAFVPYLVGDNWTSAILGGVTLLISALGFGSTIVAIGFAIVSFIVKINVARLLATLKPMQIVTLLVAQFVGALFAMMAFIAVGLIDLAQFMPPVPPA